LRGLRGSNDAQLYSKGALIVKKAGEKKSSKGGFNILWGTSRGMPAGNDKNQGRVRGKEAVGSKGERPAGDEKG